MEKVMEKVLFCFMVTILKFNLLRFRICFVLGFQEYFSMKTYLSQVHIGAPIFHRKVFEMIDPKLAGNTRKCLTIQYYLKGFNLLIMVSATFRDFKYFEKEFSANPVIPA